MLKIIYSNQGFKSEVLFYVSVPNIERSGDIEHCSQATAYFALLVSALCIEG